MHAYSQAQKHGFCMAWPFLFCVDSLESTHLKANQASFLYFNKLSIAFDTELGLCNSTFLVTNFDLKVRLICSFGAGKKT